MNTRNNMAHVIRELEAYRASLILKAQEHEDDEYNLLAIEFELDMVNEQLEVLS